MGQVLHRVANKERTTKQKVTRWQSKEEGNNLQQDSIRQITMGSIDGGLHPALDGQRLL